MNFMMNFFELYNSLEKDDVFIVAMDNLLKHKDELDKMTIYDMSEVCLVSRSTINRLAQRLGYKGFKEFKFDMVRSFSKSKLHNHLIPMTRYGSPEETSCRIIDTMEKLTALLRENITPDVLSKAAELLYHSSIVHLYTDSLLGALSLQTNLVLNGKEVKMFSVFSEQLDDVEKLTSSHAVILIKDERLDALPAAPIIDTIQKKGSKLILLGGNQGNTESTDVYLNCPSLGGGITRYGMSLVLDLLATFYRQTYMLEE